jgi:8-oxo-dGTP diphosphatase
MADPTLVTAAIVRRGDAVLIARRRLADAFPLLWEFPGGKVEPGELPEDALVRECREEMGVRIRVRALFDAIYHRYEDLSILLFFYDCDLLSGEPRPIGCQEVRFAPVHDLPAFDFLPADKVLIERLQLRFPG